MSTPGDLIDGRFELLDRLGSGAMGTVWRARDTTLGREVALKEVRPNAARDCPETARVLNERILREARSLARISHPHVVTVHQVATQGPHPWLVMELVPGESLQARLARGPLSPAEAARTGREILSALRAAHAAGIHHRDVKPANVLLRPDGSAVLTDFGIAALQDHGSLTLTGEVIGTPEYLAPERIRGEDLPASDLWSLGMMLYVSVEGVSPMRRATTLATLAAVLDGPVPPPVRAGALTPALAAVLVHDPAARPGAPALDDLLRLAAEAPAEAAGAEAPAEADAAPGAGPVPPWPEASGPAVPTQGWQALATVGTARPTRLDPAPPRTRSRLRGPLAAAAAAALLAVLGLGGYTLFKPEATGPDGAGGHASATGRPGTGGPTPSGTPAPSRTPADLGDRWIAQLHSEPESSGTAARDRRLAAVRAEIPQAQVLRSADYASLEPGYWVVYAPGPFTDGRAARAFCADHGRTTADTCIGRWLSHRPSDRP
ncbi:serine/threonine protein kinase [Streptomyces bambusae]|uniref:serine/threonine-protein kinase n=1 Tax=Streptomyces bambusae TaxID=1550616 RepID=UPI001CFFF72B|nr:serine/threonine-protein kinase [Streptomyces bambusae]MCB5169633.1 serine/threonine protein kinase [Streptomyces bambusae]